MKLALIFTNDWELFGDGSGDYFDIQHNPMNSILELFDKFGAKMTIMAEAYQQWNYLKLGEKNPEAKKIASSWEEITGMAVKSGHDVQLHLHPQWEDAKFIDGSWSFDMNKSPLSSLSDQRLNEVLSNGKSYLEGLLRTSKSDYSCTCFRAGGYYIDPSGRVINALLKNGFVCDTSVTKGLLSKGFYDFSKAHSNIFPWISSSEDINTNGNDGILEMPIYSTYVNGSLGIKKLNQWAYYKNVLGANVSKDELDWAKERDRIKEQKYPSSQRFYKRNNQGKLAKYMSAFYSRHPVQLDYDYVPASAFVKMLEDAYNTLPDEIRSSNIELPIISSGHTKDMHNTDNLKWILEKIDSKLKDKIVFRTLSEAAKKQLEILKPGV